MPPECSDGEVRLTILENETSPYLGDYYYQVIEGFLEVCYQGNWISVCLNSNNINTSQLAELACKSIYGFAGMLVKMVSIFVQHRKFIHIPLCYIRGVSF